MARKTVIELVDDINGEAADQTITFALDGVSYEIDLSEENAAKLRDDIGGWTARARRTGGRLRTTAKSSSRSGNSGAIRQWAKENGYEVSERGRISAAVQEAYIAAH